ncbi:MAG TPA: tetratricopeptide repeat protein [Planctomycetota bacterium]|nr:tetratricopeptide repeat protein [Planctomycetota bacterium]
MTGSAGSRQKWCRALQVLLAAVLLVLTVAPAGTLSAAEKTDLDWGNEYFEAGDYKKAAEAYEKAAAAMPATSADHPTDPVFVLRYLEVLRLTGQYNKARDYAVAHLPADPKTPQEWRIVTDTGELYYFHGDAAKAEALYKKGVEGGSLRCELFLKRLYLETGRRPLTRAIIDRFYDYWTRHVNELDDDAQADPDILAVIGAVIWDDNPEAPDDALNRCYARAQKIAKQKNLFNAEHYAWSGAMCIELFNFPQARDEFNAILKVRKNDPEAILGLAQAEFAQDNYKKALEEIDKVLEVNPNNVGARALAVECRLADENVATKPLDVEKELLELHKISPTHLETLGLLYGHYLMQSEDKKAREIEKEMKKLNPNPSEFYCIAGDVVERSRNFLVSGDLFQKAIDVDNKYWRAHFSFAMNRRRLGDEELAQKHFAITYKLNPYNVFAVNMRNSLRFLLGDATAQTPIPPEYVTHETEHFVLRVHTREDKILAPYYLAILEEIRTRLDKRWGFDPKGFSQDKILIEIFPTFQDFAAATVGVPNLGALGACFGPTITLVSPRVATNDAHPFFNWERVLEHEYTHAITLQLSGYKVPRWFTEGCSTHQEQDDFLYWDQLLVDGYAQKQLMPIAKINAGFTQQTFPGRIQLSYYHGKLIVDHIVRVYGLDAVKKILAAYKAGKDDIEAIKDGTGVKLEEIDQGVLEDAAKLVGQIKRRPAPEPSDLAKLQAAVEKDPNDAKAKEQLAMVLGQMGNLAGAVKLANELYAADQKNAVANKLLGIAAFLKKNYEVARAHLQVAAQADPDDFRTQFYLGMIYKNAAQSAKAIEAFKRAIEIYPRFNGEDMNHTNNTYDQLAGIYVDDGNKKAAIEVLAAAVALDKSNYAAAAKLADLRLEAKDYQGSVDAALESIYIHPYELSVHLTAGKGYTELKDYDRAEREFSVATAIDKSVIDGWIGLARARFAAKKTAGASVAITAALTLDAKNEEAVKLNEAIEKAAKAAPPDDGKNIDAATTK